MMRGILNAVVATSLAFSGSAILGLPQPDPVARVGSRAISRAMLDDAVAQALSSQYYHKTISEESRLKLERTELEVLIRRELNLAGALDRSLPLPMDEAERDRTAIEKKLGAKHYAAILAQVGMTADQHARAIAETLLAAQAYRRFVTDEAHVADSDVRTRWERDRAAWVEPEAVHLEHILLAVTPESMADTWEKRDAEARGIVEKLRAGAPFATLASARSDDMYRIKGGDLGWVHRGRLVPELEKAVWAATPGEVIGPIRSADGYHIARVIARRPERALSFDEAAPMIRKQLEQDALKTAESQWFDSLRAKHPVQVLDPVLAEGASPK